MIEQWFNASSMWLIGGFINDDIFRLLMLGGAIFPLLMGIWELIVFTQVKNILQQETEN